MVLTALIHGGLHYVSMVDIATFVAAGVFAAADASVAAAVAAAAAVVIACCCQYCSACWSCLGH